MGVWDADTRKRVRRAAERERSVEDGPAFSQNKPLRRPPTLPLWGRGGSCVTLCGECGAPVNVRNPGCDQHKGGGDGIF